MLAPAYSLVRARPILTAAAAAVLIGFVTGLQAYLARVGSADAVPLGYAVQNRTLAALAWVLVGTGVVDAARRWPLGVPTWRPRLAAHLAGAVAAGLAVNVVLHTLLWLIGADPARFTELPGVIARDALDHAHLNALVYFVVLGAAQWAAGRRRAPAPGVLPAPPVSPPPGSPYAARLTARRRDTVTIVAVDDVDWIEGADDYACLHVGARRHLTDDRLRELERMLDPSRFVRVHRSALVNLARVREVEDGRWGDAVAVLRDGTRVRVSRTRRAALMSALRPGP